MNEIELKFLINEAQLKGLLRQVEIKSAKQTKMAAYYFDTKKRELAEQNIGLRVRKEGDHWVQTMKAGGDGLAARLEHNQVLDAEEVQTMIDNQALTPDLSIYKNTPMAEALAGFSLKKLTKQLTLQYVTDINRTTRLITDEQNQSQIEVAYDVGVIKSGLDDDLQSGVHEIEFELLSGNTDFLFQTAKQWCKRYKLCLSTITKAERGGLLINQQAFSSPITASDIALDIPSDCSPFVFLQKAVQSALLQILPNTSAMLEKSCNLAHYEEGYHGLQKLASVLAAAPSLGVEINSDWQPLIHNYADQLHQKLRQLKRFDIEAKLNQQQNIAFDHQDHDEAYRQLIYKTIQLISTTDLQLTLLDLIQFTMRQDISKRSKTASNRLYKLFSKQSDQLKKTLKNHDIKALLLSTPKDEASAQMLTSILNDINQLSDLQSIAAPLFAKDLRAQDQAYRIAKLQRALSGHLDQRYYQADYQRRASRQLKQNQPSYWYHSGWFAALSAQSAKRSWQAVKDLSL